MISCRSPITALRMSVYATRYQILYVYRRYNIIIYRWALRQPCRVRRIGRLTRDAWPDRVWSKICQRAAAAAVSHRFVYPRRARYFRFARANQRKQREARPSVRPVRVLADGIVGSRAEAPPPLLVYRDHHSVRGMWYVNRPVPVVASSGFPEINSLLLRPSHSIFFTVIKINTTTVSPSIPLIITNNLSRDRVRVGAIGAGAFFTILLSTRCKLLPLTGYRRRLWLQVNIVIRGIRPSDGTEIWSVRVNNYFKFPRF